MVKPRRQLEQSSSRLSNLPFVLIAFCLWLVWFGMFWYVDPQLLQNVGLPNSYLPFLLILALALGLTVWLMRQSKVLALAWSLAVVGFLLLRLVGLGNIVNGLLVLGLLISIETYHYMSQQRGYPNSSADSEKMDSEDSQ